MSPGFFLLASEKLSSSVAVIVGKNGMGAIGVKEFLLAIRVNGFVARASCAGFTGETPVPLFAFLLAETARVISVAATTNDITARASGLRRLSRDMEHFIFPMVDSRKLLVENCGKNRFMARSLLVTARVTEFLIKFR